MPPVVRPDCPCPNTACSRHTLCDECEAYRAKRGKLPFCRRPEQTLPDRIGRIAGIGR